MTAGSESLTGATTRTIVEREAPALCMEAGDMTADTGKPPKIRLFSDTKAWTGDAGCQEERTLDDRTHRYFPGFPRVPKQGKSGR